MVALRFVSRPIHFLTKFLGFAIISKGGFKISGAYALCHYGVKGMKWGIRRTPQQLGHDASQCKTWSRLKNYKDYTSGIKRLIDSLTEEQQNYVGRGFWTDKGRTVYRNIIGNKSHVKAFVDVYNMPIIYHGKGTVVIAVENQSSGKGYATRLGKQLIEDYDRGRFGKDLESLIWNVDEGNDASDAVAKKLGFTFKGTKETEEGIIRMYEHKRPKTSTNYIEHHGIKGQKWGVRRYQNSDGSLTEEGRHHYGYGNGRKKSNGGNLTRKAGSAVVVASRGDTRREKAKSQLKRDGKIAAVNVATNIGAAVYANKTNNMGVLALNSIKSAALNAATVVNLAQAGYNYYKAGKVDKRSSSNSSLNRKSGSFINPKFLNDDGSLNEAGKADMKKYTELNVYNKQKKNYENNAKEERQKAVEKRYEPAKNITKTAEEGLSAGRKALETVDKVADVRRKRQADTMDLSSMTDQDLQRAINRMNLEQNYKRLATQKETTSGREIVESTLAIAGGTLAVASSAITIAMNIQKMKAGAA